MAIRMMTNKANAGQPNVETVTDYHGHEENRMRHSAECAHRNDSAFLFERGPGCQPHDPPARQFGCSSFGPLYMMTTHVGLVLETREYNGYDDSDFYAIVWNEEKGETERVDYASTRGWTYPNGAAVDATPEVRAKYEAYMGRMRDAARQAAVDAEARRPARGKQVKIVRGRKHYGQTGRIFWQGANRFRTYYRNGYNQPDALHNQRFGIETADGEKFFVGGDYVEVILPESELAVAA
jgi:hypothetical protein